MRTGNTAQSEQLAATAAGRWHTVQLAVFGYIGLCGVLQSGALAGPRWLELLAGWLTAAALVLAGVATYLVGRVAWPLYGQPATTATAGRRVEGRPDGVDPIGTGRRAVVAGAARGAGAGGAGRAGAGGAGRRRGAEPVAGREPAGAAGPTTPTPSAGPGVDPIGTDRANPGDSDSDDATRPARLLRTGIALTYVSVAAATLAAATAWWPQSTGASGAGLVEVRDTGGRVWCGALEHSPAGTLRVVTGQGVTDLPTTEVSAVTPVGRCTAG